MEKRAPPHSGQQPPPGRVLRDVPYYGQTRRFSCGPSSLIMVMRALAPDLEVQRALELELWREATTIHGGCGPLGLALALWRRGFAAKVWISHDGLFLAGRANDAVERETMQVLQERDLAEAARRTLPVTIGTAARPDLEPYLASGWLPIVLVNIDFEGRNITHWVVVTGYEPDAFYVNDPLVDGRSKGADRKGSALRIEKSAFERWARFGPDQERAVVLAGPRGLQASTAADYKA